MTDDVAVLQCSGASNLKTMSIGDSSTRRRSAQAVTAIGNAGGTGTLTSATGAVTGLGKAITVSDDSGGSRAAHRADRDERRRQPGDSGGPLLNSAGKVVGMDTAASDGSGSQTSPRATPTRSRSARRCRSRKQIEAGKASATVHIGATAFLGVQVEPSTATGTATSGAGR